MKPITFTYESMGTAWSVSIWDKISSVDIDRLKENIIHRSQLFDKTYSRFIESSLVSKLSVQTGIHTVPEELVAMLRLYEKMYNLSEGLFTPLVGTALEDMGYDKNYSLKEKGSIHPIPDFDRAITIITNTSIELHTPILIDLGALGKGFFGDILKSEIEQKGIQRYLVNGSGDVCYKGNGIPITVGLEHPLDSTKVIGKIQMENGAMCSSGSNRRSWGKFHHIINPDSLTSTSEIIASWVLADSAAVADGLATALFLSPPEAFEEEFTFEYLLLNKDLKVKRSEGFNAELF